MHSISIKYKDGLDENQLWHVFYSVIGNLKESGQIRVRVAVAIGIWTKKNSAIFGINATNAC